MQLRSKGKLANYFRSEEGRKYWETCFSVCPICGRELKYRMDGTFSVYTDDIIPKKMVGHGGFPTGIYTNMNIKSKDAYLYAFGVWCVGPDEKFDSCPFALNFTKDIDSSSINIGGGIGMDGRRMSTYIDGLVERHNKLQWRPGFTKHQHRIIDLSNLYWRVNNLPIDGMKNSIENDASSYVAEARHLRDTLRIMKKYQQTAYQGELKMKEIKELEDIMDGVIDRLKVLWTLKEKKI